MLSRHWTWPLSQQSHRRCVLCLVCPARAIGCMFIHPVSLALPVASQHATLLLQELCMRAVSL